MKASKLFLALILFVAMSLNANAQKRQIRNVSNFSEIHVSQGIKVSLTISDFEKVEVIAPEEYIDKVITEVKGDELNIYFKDNHLYLKNRSIEVLIHAKMINSIDLDSGASLVTANSIENVQKLEVSTSSGASANIRCKVAKAEADASSGSTILINGEATYFEVEASSGSTIKASELKAKSVDADVSSGADIRVSVSDRLHADASSGGSMKYEGSPKYVDIEKSSGGSVHKK